MNDFVVNRIRAKEAKRYIHKHHYSHGSHNGPSPCYGLYSGKELLGVLMFAVPCSENVRASIFGKDHKDKVIELHRLHTLDKTPKNTESWFISKCFRHLKKDKPEKECVIAFSDTTQGHVGIIYQATNALYYGTTSKSTFYLDKEGRLRHPRQCGVNINLKEAKNRGWKPIKRESKHRYLWLLAGKLRKRYLRNMLKVNILEYPK